MRQSITLLLTALGGLLVHAAQMTYYDAESTGGIGSCGNYIHNSDYSVAVEAGVYDGSKCGQALCITANGKSVQATMQDMCPGCQSGGLDATIALFQAFTSLSDGVLQMSWQFGSCGGGGGGGGSQPAPAPAPSPKPQQTQAPAQAPSPSPPPPPSPSPSPPALPGKECGSSGCDWSNLGNLNAASVACNGGYCALTCNGGYSLSADGTYCLKMVAPGQSCSAQSVCDRSTLSSLNANNVACSNGVCQISCNSGLSFSADGSTCLPVIAPGKQCTSNSICDRGALYNLNANNVACSNGVCALSCATGYQLSTDGAQCNLLVAPGKPCQGSCDASNLAAVNASSVACGAGYCALTCLSGYQISADGTACLPLVRPGQSCTTGNSICDRSTLSSLNALDVSCTNNACSVKCQTGFQTSPDSSTCWPLVAPGQPCNDTAPCDTLNLASLNATANTCRAGSCALTCTPAHALAPDARTCLPTVGLGTVCADPPAVCVLAQGDAAHAVGMHATGIACAGAAGVCVLTGCSEGYRLGPGDVSCVAVTSSTTTTTTMSAAASTTGAPAGAGAGVAAATAGQQMFAVPLAQRVEWPDVVNPRRALSMRNKCKIVH